MKAATRECLEQRPHLEETLADIVELDRDGPWEFGDLDCDSGDFGYLVSREFIEESGSGYQLVDREATAAALEEGIPVDEGQSNGSSEDEQPNSESTEIAKVVRAKATNLNSGFWIPLGISFLFLLIMRSLTYKKVFRDGHVMTTGNDPYHYRYWVDQLLAESPGIFSFGEIAAVLGDRAVNGDPLTYVIYWWFSLLGGNPETSGAMIALFPVVSALIVGALTAWMALVVTEDERIAVVTLLSFAVIPSHALYSGIGFTDHSPVDFLWLAIMAASLVWLARDLERSESGMAHLTHPGTWIVTAVFGVATASSMLSWNGAPLLLLGVGVYAAVRPASEIRTDNSPLLTSLPLLAGLTVGTAIGHLFHTSFGWQEPAVVYAPAVVLGGAVSVTLLAEAADRHYPDPRLVVGGIAGIGVVGLFVVRTVTPGVFTRYSNQFSDALIGRSGIAETGPLVSTDLAVLFGPVDSRAWFVFFAVPALAFVTWKCIDSHEPGWLVLSSYAWPLLILATLQVRFLGEFAPFAALFAAVGIVWLLARFDLCLPLACFKKRAHRRLRPLGGLQTVNQGLYITFALVVVLALGSIILAITMGTLAVNDGEYQAATWIEDDIEGDEEEFVLSWWSRNRMYNYVAWGGGDGYGYARNTHEDFLASEHPDQWYERFNGSVGYIVIEDQNIPRATQPRELTTYEQLRNEYGSATEVEDGVGHFQLDYITEFGSHAVFKPVEGATIEGMITERSSITVTTDVKLEHLSFTYSRRTSVDEQGKYNVTVAQPGEYSVGDTGNVTITKEDIQNGATVQTPLR